MPRKQQNLLRMSKLQKGQRNWPECVVLSVDCRSSPRRVEKVVAVLSVRFGGGVSVTFREKKSVIVQSG